MKRTKAIPATLLTGGWALLTACAGTAPQPRATGPVDARAVVVEVENQNWLDVAVYAAHAGARQRLGTVGSMQSREFTLPAGFAGGSGAFRLVAEPVGSRQSVASDPIAADPGSHVEWRVQNHLAMSSYRVTPLALRTR